jgi:hypothetical protein
LPQGSIGIRDAESLLWTALQTNQLQATGIPIGQTQRKLIPDFEWRDLKAVEERGRDIVRYDRNAGQGYHDVAFRSRAVMALWPERRSMQDDLKLPPTIIPDGSGYFPLYCAAQWIATRGGTLDFDPTDETIWRDAYSELARQISSGHVTVTGVAVGIREKVDAHIFASLPVDYPFADTPASLISRDELFLSSYPFDEEYWQKGFNDTLQARGEIRWSKLMVLKSEVAERWPFQQDPERSSVSAEFRTGAPGRPTPIHLVLSEHQRRLSAGEAEKSVTLEAEMLARWLQDTHPDVPRLTPKTIRNRISSAHRRG